ncbi:unnamed protein product [Closterium sp. NIES-53]
MGPPIVPLDPARSALALSGPARTVSRCPAATRSACPPHVVPCCSPHVALCCSSRHALLQPAHYALLPCASRPAAASASRPTAGSASRSAALRISLCCPARRALLQPARRALLQPARRTLLPRASRPAIASASRPTAARASRPAALHSAHPAALSTARPAMQPTARPARPSRAAQPEPPCPTRAAPPYLDHQPHRAALLLLLLLERRSLPLSDDPTPQQLREWVLQRARPGGGGFGFLRTAQRRQQSQQETFSLQVLSELFPQRCVTGSVEAAALGASESAAALGASESVAALGASKSAADLGARASPATVVARASTVLPCPAVPSGSLSGIHQPTFSTNLVSNAAIQDVWVDTFIPGGQSVEIYSSLAPPPRSPLPAASPQHALPSPCLWPSQRTAPHSSEFPPTTAPLQTLHMDVWGPTPVGGTDQERYFLLVVDDYTRYTINFPLRRKADVSGVLIPWIRATRRHLRERFRREFPLLRLHSDKGGEFSSDLLAQFCRDEGIHQPRSRFRPLLRKMGLLSIALA